jgi:hypothetical protein
VTTNRKHPGMLVRIAFDADDVGLIEVETGRAHRPFSSKSLSLNQARNLVCGCQIRARSLADDYSRTLLTALWGHSSILGDNAASHPQVTRNGYCLVKSGKLHAIRCGPLASLARERPDLVLPTQLGPGIVYREHDYPLQQCSNYLIDVRARSRGRISYSRDHGFGIRSVKNAGPHLFGGERH